jgi:DNA-directed RNA polymerase specialized sigma24 family protein
VAGSEALGCSGAESPDADRVIQLRLVADFSVDQAAIAIGVSDRTVNRLWTFGRAWLHRAVREVE